jgi:hypothetical protein
MENGTFELIKLKPFNEGKLMEGIFTYQKNLLNRYRALGMVPSYPLDLNSRDSQDFIRKTIGWVIEELAEAMENFDGATEIFNNEIYSDSGVQKKILNYLIPLTEELMDVLHFMVELLYYSGIEADDMLGYYKSRLTTENYHEAFMTGDALTTSMMYARHININNDVSRIALYNSFKLETSNEEAYYRALSMELPADSIVAGTKLGPELQVLIERLCWAITQKLFKAKNKLKMKDWKTSEVTTNIQAYQEDLMEAWVALSVLLDTLQLTDKAIYFHYEKTNYKNQERLNSGY